MWESFEGVNDRYAKTLFPGRLLHFAAHFVCHAGGRGLLGYPRPPKRLVLNSSALFQGLLVLSTPLHRVGLKLRNQSSLVAVCSGRDDSPVLSSEYPDRDQSWPPMRQRRRSRSVVSYLTQRISNISRAEHLRLPRRQPVQVQSAFNTLLGSFQQNGHRLRELV